MLTFTYDITLVAAALCVSMIAAFTGLTLTQGLSALPHTQRKVFVSMAALALGGGIWSTHFIAMLALQLPVDIGYDPLFTLASVMFAVLLVGVALLLMHFSQRNRRNIIISGVLIGAGIVSMHFVGMLGIRGCIPQFEDMGKLVSSLVAEAMGVAAIQISYGRRTQGSIVFGTIVFGLSVVLTHFAAMYWTGFARLPQDIVIEPSISDGQLAMIVILAAFVICGAFLLSASTFALKGAAPANRQFAPELSSLPAEMGDQSVGLVLNTAINESAGAMTGSGFSEAAPAHPLIEGFIPEGIQVPYESDNKTYFLKPSEVSAVRAEGHYTMLYANGDELFCPWSITTAQSRLPEKMFFHTHRSYLVNVGKIAAFERHKDNGICVLNNEAIKNIPVSRSKVNALKDILGL